MKKCPFCAEEIQDDAIKCRYCGEFLSGKKSNGCLKGCLISVVVLVISVIALVCSGFFILNFVINRFFSAFDKKELYMYPPFMGWGFEGMLQGFGGFFRDFFEKFKDLFLHQQYNNQYTF